MAKLLIFDFDGTLCDTGPSIHAAINKTLTKMGHNELPMELVLNCIGGGFEKLASKAELDKVIGLERIPEFIEIFRTEYDKVFREESKPFEGVIEFLKAWPHEMAIASNKEVEYIHAILEKEPFNEFEWVGIYGGKCFENKKPSPEMIHAILEDSTHGPDQALMIGDGHPDIEVAKNAGIRSVAVSFGYCHIDELMGLGADAQINHFSELEKTIKHLFG